MEENLGNTPVLAAAGFASQHLAASARMLVSMHDASVHAGVRGSPKSVSIALHSRFRFGSERIREKNLLPPVVFPPMELSS